MDSETRFCALFEMAYPPLCRYARHRGLSGSDAEDLVAQTLEVAWRRIGDVPADDPMPWLYAVARNLWRNQRRRERRRHYLLSRLRANLPSESVEIPLEPGAIRAALASLRESDQEILRLIAWDGLTPAQAAVVLGCGQVAARSRLHRARNRLAARLGLDPDVQRAAGRRQELGNSLDAMEVQR
jgi:RNA polymerase sigma factor (sigma-70 family)